VSVAASSIVEDLYLGYSSWLPVAPARPLKCCSDHSLDLLREMNMREEFNEEIATIFGSSKWTVLDIFLCAMDANNN
jgi:hypothetical protein